MEDLGPLVEDRGSICDSIPEDVGLESPLAEEDERHRQEQRVLERRFQVQVALSGPIQKPQKGWAGTLVTSPDSAACRRRMI